MEVRATAFAAEEQFKGIVVPNGCVFALGFRFPGDGVSRLVARRVPFVADVKVFRIVTKVDRDPFRAGGHGRRGIPAGVGQVPVNRGRTNIIGSSLLAFYCFHEILRQSRPSVFISSDVLRWQPAALWRPEETVSWKDILRVESRSFRLLTLTTRTGTPPALPLLGISAPERKEISEQIAERIAK